MSTSKISLELRADEDKGNSNSVTLYDLESWIEEVKRHTDSDNVSIQLLVGVLRVER